MTRYVPYSPFPCCLEQDLLPGLWSEIRFYYTLHTPTTFLLFYSGNGAAGAHTVTLNGTLGKKRGGRAKLCGGKISCLDCAKVKSYPRGLLSPAAGETDRQK